MSKPATRPLPPPADAPAPLSAAITQAWILVNDLRGYVQDNAPPKERKSRAERKADRVLTLSTDQDRGP